MYTAKNYEHLIGLEGMSEQMLRNHFALYEGYATNVNQITELIKESKSQQEAASLKLVELKRRLSWEWNGMRLHEYYFENLKKGGSEISDGSDLAKKMAQDFGSFDDWVTNFKGVATMRGVGWAVLYYDPQGDQLFNAWISEHDGGHLAGCAPLLVADVFEHAFTLDYGTKRAGYVDAFMKAIEWSVVEKRFECQCICQHEKA